ncbi:cytochrome c biogenesis protein CcdA/thiol-disulfide isomerase/thioredoxin [Microbacteriaceae bacterium SG_E_30_P1]|uniref:Cytochrome c biogenesis protein CcdA/thiol-disulfide isomerase/thioredoxin n=1 Tax=Antiquaquibacter oligotrophicus TaxID=2880260 RepID=A0ABT6KKS8_9MICO|nr:cytochrome c biogenesis protein DipZ [Antiquaquibacter oligotrophicus]MDH6180053.1 cytochrome c biogenesis protein CcdA/thiol-disulfide isomerase/thioredoxin [Antiquaquibacter oligotrophicus]
MTNPTRFPNRSEHPPDRSCGHTAFDPEVLVLSLALIGFLGGLITGISPCILPVLPVIFLSGGAMSARDADAPQKVSRWRPFQVIAGLVVAFSLFTLIGSLILALLGLPQDFLRWAGIVVLVLIGVGLIVPAFQHILEKPFSWIPQKNVGTERGGFVLGLALGAVYVPCAGPVLAAITVAGSTGNIGPETIVLTLSFAIGAALPLLIFALAGRRVAERVKTFRKHQAKIRTIGGVVMIALAVGLVFNLPQLLQRLVPDYTSVLQDQFASDEAIAEQLDLGGLENDQNKDLDLCTNGASELESCGTAPDIKGIQEWFNTPNNEPIDLADLKGKVVLIDFWAYSCINCQRSIPHTVAWNEAYKDAGLEVIGIHSPEYAFEKEPRNVKAGAQNFGITYPVALDNNLSTWTNYRNRYWPAHYLIDADGVVRHVKFGEGGYATTEKLIRELLEDADPGVQLPAATDVEDDTPEAGSTTPETYLSLGKVVNFAGDEEYASGVNSYRFPKDQPKDSFALQGEWELGFQNATPSGGEASIRLNYTAREVRMVLGGEGTVTLKVGDQERTIDVSGTPNSYSLIPLGDPQQGTLEVTVSPGVEAYSFTFG